MENQNSSRIKLTYGIILGVILVGISVVNYLYGDIYNQSRALGLVTKAVFIGAIVWAIKLVKEENSGILSVNDAVKTGLAIGLIAGLIVAVYQYIEITYLAPDFIEKAKLVQEEVMLQSNPNMSEEELEMALDMSAMITKPTVITALRIAGNLIGGLIVGAIAGLIMKKEEVEFQ